jgi:uncharacterized protein YjiS (DUF1127 family)
MKLFRTLSRAAAQEWNAGRARRQLHQLNDYMLSDIGISRGEIDGAVRGFDRPSRRARS